MASSVQSRSKEQAKPRTLGANVFEVNKVIRRLIPVLWASPLKVWRVGQSRRRTPELDVRQKFSSFANGIVARHASVGVDGAYGPAGRGRSRQQDLALAVRHGLVAALERDIKIPVLTFSKRESRKAAAPTAAPSESAVRLKPTSELRTVTDFQVCERLVGFIFTRTSCSTYPAPVPVEIDGISTIFERHALGRKLLVSTLLDEVSLHANKTGQ